MSHVIRLLALCVFASSVTAAHAFACEESTAKAIAKAAAKAAACNEKTAKAIARAAEKVAAKATCEAKAFKMVMDVDVQTNARRCIDVEVKAVKNINAQRARRSGWSPGHLIEPDSMKLGPGDDLKSPETEQWVIISARTGTVQIRQYPKGGRNMEGRTLQQHGP